MGKTECMKKIPLHWKIMIAMVLGIIWALISGTFGLNDFTRDWIDPFGKIFINCLKFIAIPLVLFSIVSGVTGMGDPTKLGKIGLKTLLLFLVTTVTSISLGLIIVNLVKPGVQTDEKIRMENRLTYEIWATQSGIELKDSQRALENADPKLKEKIEKKLAADMQSEDYQALAVKNEQAKATSTSPLQPLVDIVPENLIIALGDGKLMLQVIFFALFFGIALALLPREKVGGVVAFFEGMNEVFVKMVHIIMIAAPFFVFCLMAGVLAKSADSIDQLFMIFKQLGSYALVVVAGLAILLFGFYPLLLRVFGVRISYTAFFKGMSPAQFLAFSTSSSAATLPVTIECVDKNLKVPKSIYDFVLPIGATVNMDGTSLYQAVAVVFLAQYHDVDLSLMQQIGIIGTATLASIGAAAIPSAGLIMLMIVLTSVGLNPLWVALIMPVDRILDMCRTTVNVTSDATVSAIIAKMEEKKA